MKRIPAANLATAAVLLCGLAVAQSAAPAASGAPQQTPSTPSSAEPGSAAAAPANSAPRIAPGSVIPVQLTKSLDAKKVKTGDEVDAKVTEDMKAGNGEVIVPKDTKVVGRITEAQARSKEQKESQLGIAFDRAVMKNGGDIALPMSVQAIISPTYLSGGNSNNSSADSGGSSSPGSTGGGSPAMGSGRSGSAGAPQSSLPSSSGTGTADNPPSAGPRQPINGNTQGVLGFQNLQLSNASDAKQGSVVTSEKNNVKLDSGTMMLLKVNQ
jgi:hypothetical protein